MDYMTQELIEKLKELHEEDLCTDNYRKNVVGNKVYRTTIYELTTDDVVLKLWNTSNNQRIEDWNSLKQAIIEKLREDEWSAHDLSDGWNCWMYEVEEL